MPAILRLLQDRGLTQRASAPCLAGSTDTFTAPGSPFWDNYKPQLPSSHARLRFTSSFPDYNLT